MNPSARPTPTPRTKATDVANKRKIANTDCPFPIPQEIERH